jgi:hypothetical protein
MKEVRIVESCCCWLLVGDGVEDDGRVVVNLLCILSPIPSYCKWYRDI